MHPSDLKKFILTRQIQMNQMGKARQFDMARMMQEQQQTQAMMQQRMQQENMMKEQLMQNNLDTPASRELYQIKTLLAGRQRPRQPSLSQRVQSQFLNILLNKSQAL